MHDDLLDFLKDLKSRMEINLQSPNEKKTEITVLVKSELLEGTVVGPIASYRHPSVQNVGVVFFTGVFTLANRLLGCHVSFTCNS